LKIGATMRHDEVCRYRKSNPLAVDRESGDATARCRICAN
jgi:hypothetical protein